MDVTVKTPESFTNTCPKCLVEYYTLFPVFTYWGLVKYCPDLYLHK